MMPKRLPLIQSSENQLEKVLEQLIFRARRARKINYSNEV
jgi:hypothetical protein